MRRRLAVVAAGLAASVVAAALYATRPDPPRTERPVLLLVTSLPLVFGEKFALGGGGSAALTALSQKYRVVPIAIADSAHLAGHRLLLMAQPRAQTAEALVDLDAWVRRGGRLILLADPLLEWPSSRPLGNKLRPPPGFADTGLLRHWGVEMEGHAERRPVVETVDGRRVTFFSPGTLRSSNFSIIANGRAGRGRVGRGEVMIVADADLLSPSLSGAGEESNLAFVIAEINRIER